MKAFSRRMLLAAGLAGLVASLGGAWLLTPGGQNRTVAGVDAATLARGQQLYTQHCASCHGAELEGQPNWRQRRADGRLPAPPHDASGHTWHHSDAQLFELTKRGPAGLVPGYETDMPAFGDVLDDKQIRAVLLFIKSTWPADIRARQEALGTAGQRR
ncbi:c-type cytochrome [Roseicella frigidaeris]|nr:c-type cytochrome [Roseicella frigidaeris]